MSLKKIKNTLASLLLATLIPTQVSAENLKMLFGVGYSLPKLRQETTQYEGGLVTEIGLGYEGKEAGISISGSSFSATGNFTRDKSRGFFSESSASQTSSLEIKTLRASFELNLANNQGVRSYLIFSPGVNTINFVERQAESRTGLSFGETHDATIQETSTIPSISLGLGMERREKNFIIGAEADYTNFEKGSSLKNSYAITVHTGFTF